MKVLLISHTCQSRSEGQPKAGLLVPPDDAPALARALAQLLADPARAQAMGEAGFERYQTHFTAARMARQTLDVYKKILS